MTLPSPFLILQARAEARAILYAAGELGDDIRAAIAPLFDSGVNIGEDEVYAIVKQAFAPVVDKTDGNEGLVAQAAQVAEVAEL